MMEMKILRFRFIVACVMSLQALEAAREASVVSEVTSVGCCCWGPRSPKVAPAPSEISPAPHRNRRSALGLLPHETSPSSASTATGSPESLVIIKPLGVAPSPLPLSRPANVRGSESCARSRTMTAWSDSTLSAPGMHDWQHIQALERPLVKFIKSLHRNSAIVTEEDVLQWVNVHVCAIPWISQEEHNERLVGDVMKKVKRLMGADEGARAIIGEGLSSSLAQQVLPYAPIIEGHDTRPYYAPFMHVIRDLINVRPESESSDKDLIERLIADQVNAMPWSLGTEVKPAFIAEIIREIEACSTSAVPASHTVLTHTGVTSSGVYLRRGYSGGFLAGLASTGTGEDVKVPG
jgi:hypothetical protein